MVILSLASWVLASLLCSHRFFLCKRPTWKKVGIWYMASDPCTWEEHGRTTFSHGLGACASATQNVKQIAVNESGTFQRRTAIWFRYRQNLKPTTKLWCQGVLHRQSSLIEGVHKALYLQHVWNQNSIRSCQFIIESAIIWSLCFDFLGSPAT